MKLRLDLKCLNWWTSSRFRQSAGFTTAIAALFFAFGNPANAQSPCSGAPGERMVGMTQSGSGIAGTPICVVDGPASGHPQTSRPKYKEPPPPKGWEKRFGAFVWFPTWVSINERDASKRYGYALTLNYESEAEARHAVMRQCLNEVVPGEEGMCVGNMITPIEKAYFRVTMDFPRGFAADDFPALRPLLDARKMFVVRGNEYAACNQPGNKECLNSLIGMGRNGVHLQGGDDKARDFVPCPAGLPSPEMKVVGSDGSSRTPVPLCGPDWDVIELNLHRDRYDGFAVHPLLKGLPFASGGHKDGATAERAAMALCSSAFGDGCRPFGSHVNGYSAVAANDRGEMFLGRGKRASDAVEQAQRLCNDTSGQIIPCLALSLRLAGAVSDETASYEYNRGGFGAIAAPGGKITQAGKAWFSRGMPSLEEAEQYALQQCQRANRSAASCIILASGFGVLMTSWVGLDGSAGVFVSLDSYSFGDGVEKRRDKIVKAMCAARRTICKWNESYSTNFSKPDVGVLLIGKYDAN